MQTNTNTDLKLAALLMDVVTSVMRDIRSEVRQHRGHDLTIAQFRVLARLSRETKTNLELAEEIGVSVAAMSRMVQYLVDRNLIQKKASAIDQRALVIEISPLGKKSYCCMRKEAQKGLAKKIKTLDQQKKKDIFHGLECLQEMTSE